MAAFGASVDGVQGLLATQRFTEATQPTYDQVLGFLDTVSGWVTARLGAIATLPADRREQVETAARGVVELGAAAMAEDAAHPAMVAVDETSYGRVLWNRYREQLADLVASLPAAVLDPDAAGVTGQPAHSFPRPLLRRDTGF